MVILGALAILASQSCADGQGTVGSPVSVSGYLNGACEVPSNDSTNSGVAALTYTVSTVYPPPPPADTVLHCQVDLPLSFSPTTARLYGPAMPNQTGPLILDFGQSRIVTNVITVIGWPPVTNPPSITNVSVVFTNTLVATPQQMNEVSAGLWYVEVASLAYPAGELRGQVTSSPVLSQPRSEGAGGFAFQVTGPPSQNYEIQMSTDLVYWSTLTAVSTTNSLFRVVDPDAINSRRRFYRARYQ